MKEDYVLKQNYFLVTMEDIMKRLFQVLPFFFFVGLYFIVLIPFVYYFFRMGYRVEINYNEGWNVFHTIDVFLGKPLYNTNLTPVNYPPLSFFFIAFIMHVIRQPLLIGRVLSFVSLASICCMVGIILAKHKANSREVSLSCLFLLLLCTLFASDYVGMDDPQMLGEAVLLLGYGIYISGHISLKRLSLVACLCVTGLFIKQNIVALPLALSVHIFLFKRKYFFFWMVLFMGLAFGYIVMFHIYSHGVFLPSLFFLRMYDTFYLLQKIYLFFLVSMPLLVVILIFFLKCKRLIWKEQNALGCLYLFFALLFGVFFSGGSGTNFNLFFDSFIALAITFGMSFVSLRVHKNFFIYKIFLIYSSFYILILGLLVIELTSFEDLVQKQQQTGQIATFIKEQKGPAFCSDILFCYFADTPFVVDPFLSMELVVTGSMDKKVIFDLFKRQRFAVVELNFHPFSLKEKVYAQDLEKTIRDTYVVTKQEGKIKFYKPK